MHTSDSEIPLEGSFKKEGLVEFAGTHLLIDIWGASNLDDPKGVDDALSQAARDTGATILHTYFHHFSPNGGVSGVVVLAESHISIHTWPERGYAAIDIFTCGKCDPHRALSAIRDAFKPQSLQVSDQKRGIVTE